MVLLHSFDKSQTRLSDFGYISERKLKNPRGSKRDVVASRENEKNLARHGRTGNEYLQTNNRTNRSQTKRRTNDEILFQGHLENRLI